MYRGCKIAVVMPLHNEQAQIERAIKRVPAFVDSIVAVDDASTDSSLDELSRIDAARLRVLVHETNRGVGAATKTGYRHALSAGVDLIAVMDGDGQMDGRDLSRLLDGAIDGADYVKGNRFLSRDTIGRMPRVRYIGNRVFSFLTRLAARFDASPNASLDAHCGFTVIRRTALERLALDELYDRYGFPTEMFFAALRAGLRVRCVPVTTVYGDEVSDINPFKVVPAILYLIVRGYLRRKIGSRKMRLASDHMSKNPCEPVKSASSLVYGPERDRPRMTLIGRVFTDAGSQGCQLET
jgi:glycosyltransferase involved in cell wall biosynthesis